MFESAAVSQQVEQQRAESPNYLTSKVVMLGTLVTKGNHLHLDRYHGQWKQALEALVQQMQQTLTDVGTSQIMMRDFMGEEDRILKAAMLELGLVSLRMPDNHVIEDLSWADHDAYMRTLDGRYRSDLRRKVLKNTAQFDGRTGALDSTQTKHAYALYERVFERSLELNVHKLPFDLFEMMAKDPAYDIIQLYLQEDPQPEAKAVAVMFSHFEGRGYHAMFVGLDYGFLASHGVYKRILYQTVQRSRALNASRIGLAFTAKMAKRKIGARPQPTFAFVQLADHFNAIVMDAMPKVACSA